MCIKSQSRLHEQTEQQCSWGVCLVSRSQHLVGPAHCRLNILQDYSWSGMDHYHHHSHGVGAKELAPVQSGGGGAKSTGKLSRGQTNEAISNLRKWGPTFSMGVPPSWECNSGSAFHSPPNVFTSREPWYPGLTSASNDSGLWGHYCVALPIYVEIRESLGPLEGQFLANSEFFRV